MSIRYHRSECGPQAGLAIFRRETPHAAIADQGTDGSAVGIQNGRCRGPTILRIDRWSQRISKPGSWRWRYHLDGPEFAERRYGTLPSCTWTLGSAYPGTIQCQAPCRGNGSARGIQNRAQEQTGICGIIESMKSLTEATRSVERDSDSALPSCCFVLFRHAVGVIWILSSTEMRGQRNGRHAAAPPSDELHIVGRLVFFVVGKGFSGPLEHWRYSNDYCACRAWAGSCVPFPRAGRMPKSVAAAAILNSSLEPSYPVEIMPRAFSKCCFAATSASSNRFEEGRVISNAKESSMP